MNQALFDAVDLNDLRVALAVAEHGTLRAAATQLGTSHTTVSRRVTSLEVQLGARLFDRVASGLQPTEAGRAVLDVARVLRNEIQGLERGVLGQDLRLSGRIRVSLPDLLATHLLMPDLARFADEYTAIDLELHPSYAIADLARRDADIALRLMPHGQSPQEDLVGRRLCAVHQCAYASADWLARHPDPTHWVGWAPDNDWIDSSPRPDLPARHALDGALLQLAAARSGLGLAVLPCLLGDPAPELVRLGRVEPWPRWDLWVLVHPDLRNTARMVVFRRFLFEALAGYAPLLTGATP
ncbi:MAG: LysR family transcriptional regulator [Myxococcales bacterium]|nr:LysR family transcriptional regulator [Myxococcales bacterium]